MSYKYYIQNCIDMQDNEELLMSWYYLGMKEATSTTKVYTKDSLYKISVPGAKYNDFVFWCDENFVGTIDWKAISVLSDANRTIAIDGVNVDCFSFFETKLDVSDQENIIAAHQNDTPFSLYSVQEDHSGDILMDDDTYYQIMQVVGMPYVTQKELEYNRQAILKLAIEPALKAYYKYFPIRKEDQVPINGNYDIKYPEMAYRAIAWTTQAGMSSKISPLAALGSRAIIQGGMRTTVGNFSAITYNKPVPGWTGRGDSGTAISDMAQTYPMVNTMKNISRREHLSKIKMEDGYHAKGYSTIGGILNIVWLCWSRDWDDTDFEDFDDLLALCQASVKINIGSIRGLLKTDSNLPFNAEEMRKEGQQEWKDIIKEWKESPFTKIYTPQRGGMI